MSDFAAWERLALDSGFTYAWELDAGKLKFYPEVREMCAADKCHCYNKSWVCPPAFGELSVGERRAAAYTRGILVQTVRELEDSFDIDGINAAAAAHNKSFDRLFITLRKEYPELFAMGMGGCTRCETCTWPDAPCRKPDIAVPSMEAWGLMVSEVCADCGAKYCYAPNTIMYASCFLLDKQG